MASDKSAENEVDMSRQHMVAVAACRHGVTCLSYGSSQLKGERCKGREYESGILIWEGGCEVYKRVDGMSSLTWTI